jgi:hypothetical protein
MITNNQLKYLQSSGLQPNQIAQVVRSAGGYDESTRPKSIAGFAGNVLKSGVRAVGDLGGAVINTVNPNMEKNTVANLLRLGDGILSLVMPGEQINEKNAKAVGKFYMDRYGSLDNAFNTLYNDPVGLALDVSTVISGAGGALKGAGTLSKISGLTKVGNAFSKAAAFTDPFSMMGKGIGKVSSGSGKKIALGLDRAGENIVTRGIGNPAAQAKAAQKAGRSVSSFIDEYNLYDRSPETAGAVKRGIMDNYDNLALNSGKQVQMGQLITYFNNEIAKLQSGVSGVVSDANQAKIAELMRRRDQLLQAAGGKVANGELLSSPLQVGADTLTNFRRNVIDPDVPQSMFNLDARGSGAAQGVKQARDIVKSGIDSTDPRLAKLGSDYGMAKSVEKILTQADARGQNRQIFNFTKLGGAGLGGIVAGAPAAVGGFVAEQVVNSPRFIKGASKTMRATSAALQNPGIGQSVARMGRIASPGYQYSKYGRIANNINFDQKTPISTNTQKPPQIQPEKRQLSPSATPNQAIKPAYSPMPKLQPYKMPSQSKSTQAFGGSVKVKRGSFY